MNFEIRFLPRLFIRALLELRPKHLGAAASSIWTLLLRPGRYTSWRAQPSALDPMLLLLLSIPLSFVRFAADPNVNNTIGWLGLTLVPHSLGVVLFAMGSAIGAVLIPMFWYRVLSLSLPRELFIAAMIAMYAVVEIPWDLSSVLWMPFVHRGDIPFWLPDCIKTLVVTLYCMLAGRSLDRAHLPTLEQAE